jgi:hypothetical protein
MKKIINIPFFKNQKEIYLFIKEIRKQYLSGWNIIKSDFSYTQNKYLDNGIEKSRKSITGVDILLEKNNDGNGVEIFNENKPKLILEKKQLPNPIINKGDKINSPKIKYISPEINYLYWRKNYIEDIESKKPKNRTINSLNNIRKQILNHLENKSILKTILIKDELENRSMKILENHAIKIAKKIQIEKIEKNKTEYYIEVFDTINAWGGAAIRMFYNKKISLKDENKTKGIPRVHVKLWINKYIKVVELIKKGNYDDALQIIDIEIPGLGVSFGTKHIWFWSEFFIKNNFNKHEIATIYDERISKLLLGRTPKAQDYFNARMIYKDIRDNINKNLDSNNKFSSKDVERALFAFSQYYFNNNLTGWGDDEKLNKIPSKNKATQLEINVLKEDNALINIKMKNKLKNGVDFDIASKIFDLRNPEMATMMSNFSKIKQQKVQNDQNIEYKIVGSKGVIYTITNYLGKYSCTCSAFKYNPSKDCKHILSVKK